MAGMKAYVYLYCTRRVLVVVLSRYCTLFIKRLDYRTVRAHGDAHALTVYCSDSILPYLAGWHRRTVGSCIDFLQSWPRTVFPQTFLNFVISVTVIIV